jgi:putative membrane protein
MKHVMAAFSAALVAGSMMTAAHAADPVSSADRAFVAMVSQGGMFEVKAGQLGAEQGHAQDIRDQGNTEAHDHQGVGERLKAISTEAGITFSDTLNPQFQKQLDDLKALSGTAFDAAYLRDMEAIHAKDGAAFATEAKSGTNPKLRAFAAETHRIVERHIGELKAVGP